MFREFRVGPVLRFAFAMRVASVDRSNSTGVVNPALLFSAVAVPVGWLFDVASGFGGADGIWLARENPSPSSILVRNWVKPVDM